MNTKFASKVYTKGTLETFFPPNPQARRKERSHELLGISKVLARSRESMTLCHENEEVQASDSDTA